MRPANVPAIALPEMFGKSDRFCVSIVLVRPPIWSVALMFCESGASV